MGTIRIPGVVVAYCDGDGGDSDDEKDGEKPMKRWKGGSWQEKDGSMGAGK